MVRFALITVVLLDNTTVQFHNKTLTEVVNACMQPNLERENPLLLKVGTAYNLYFNKDLLNDWLNKEIDLEELLHHVKVDHLVRNKTTIEIDGQTVEDDSLWLVKNNICILAEADKYLAVRLNNGFKLFN